jgi:hypothetical protein
MYTTLSTFSSRKILIKPRNLLSSFHFFEIPFKQGVILLNSGVLWDFSFSFDRTCHDKRNEK